jgi:hypothetical protein
MIVGSEHIGKEENFVLACVPIPPSSFTEICSGVYIYIYVLKYNSAHDLFEIPT